MVRSMFHCAVMGLFVGLVADSIQAQPQIPQPQPSPQASVTQTIGVATVTVNYHRPAVKGRTLWGDLVPYNEVWRAGANENTTVTFSHDVQVGDKPLPAGTYGLHMIPTPTTWTVILSKNATSWGSYYYKPEEDAIRIVVTPEPSSFTEWLSYQFSDITDAGTVLSLAWEKLRVPVSLSFNTPALTFAFIRNEYLRGIQSFGWQGPLQAAQYCLQHNRELDQALVWADLSISRQENFGNLRTKAAILEKLGKTQEAKPLNDRAMKLATEADINILGYTMMNSGKMKDAIALFQKNVKDYPDSWNVYDSLAEALEKNGDRKGAIANYDRALKMVGDEQNKKRITETLTRLRSR